MDYANPVSEETINTVKAALEANNMKVTVVDTGEAAKQLVEELIPAGSEVMQMQSQTLENTGISALINESGKYDSARAKLNDPNVSAEEKMRVANLPEYAVASAHALTENGQIVVASNTGSQMAAEVYTAGKVIYIVGAQKLVKDLDAAFKRIYDYILPLESVRVQKAYGMERSNVSKLLIINKEVKTDRIHVIISREALGY